MTGAWVVIIDDGVEATDAWYAYDSGDNAGKPFTRAEAESLAEASNDFIQTQGFAKALPLTETRRRV